MIEVITDKMPNQYKLDFALWTRRSIAQLIHQFWGITIPDRTMDDYLKRWGFTPKKPVKRAWEQNSAKVEAWLRDEYPQIKPRARKEGATIFWGDETGIKSTTQHGRCYAPKGKRPVQPLPAKRVSVNMVSAITNQGTSVFWCMSRQ